MTYYGRKLSGVKDNGLGRDGNMNNLESVDRKILDYETGLHRFMEKEALFKKFLLKFTDDQSFPHLKENIEKQDCEEAFREAHTLKGVAANLALNELSEAASELTELLRAKKLEEAKEKLPMLEEAYGRVQSLLAELKD